MIDFCLMKRKILILILIASVIMLSVEECHAVVTDPIVEVFENVSACHELNNPRNLNEASSLLDTATKDTIKYLGLQESVEACSAAALAWRNVSEPNQRCRSTCWWKQPQPQPQKQKQKRSQDPLGCYCRVTPLWLPLPDVDVESAVIHWPCTSPGDCSYNGVCSKSTGKCDCDGAWGGVRCGELQLLPVDRATHGFREVNTSIGYANVSTWGAPILWDEVSKQWHGWVSEMINGCGINAWEANSQIVHIIGNSPTGPFERRSVFAPPFAHEANVVRDPKGKWVMVYSAYNSISAKVSVNQQGYNATSYAHAVCTNCSQGASLSPAGSKGCPFQRGHPASLRHAFVQMMAVADNPYGPWTHQEIHPLTTGWDWNTALTINNDGSAVALIRGGMVWHADNYASNETWHPVGVSSGKQSPQWEGIGVEDPYIWKDSNGVYHALAHAFSPFYGVHAFVHPEDVPANFSDGRTIMKWTVGGVSYGNTVRFTDGRSFAFSRRERPHLIWSQERDGVPAIPVALSNGVQYGGVANAVGEDTVFTLVQPILRLVRSTATQPKAKALRDTRCLAATLMRD